MGQRLGTEPADGAAQDAVLRVVERFALLMTESGMPRMPARVFAYLLAATATEHTAGALAAGLRVSPAAISGAVRYLQQAGFVVREREPGARTDHYRLRPDLWYEMYGTRIAVVQHWEEVAAEGAELLGAGHPGGARLREAQEFFAFVRDELPAMMERWHRQRDAALGSGAGDAGRATPPLTEWSGRRSTFGPVRPAAPWRVEYGYHQLRRYAGRRTPSAAAVGFPRWRREHRGRAAPQSLPPMGSRCPRPARAGAA